MLTLPERFFRPLEPCESLSLELLGVVGYDLAMDSVTEGVGDKRGFVGEAARGGVVGRFVTGVAGISCSSGAESCVGIRAAGIGDRAVFERPNEAGCASSRGGEA